MSEDGLTGQKKKHYLTNKRLRYLIKEGIDKNNEKLKNELAKELYKMAKKLFWVTIKGSRGLYYSDKDDMVQEAVFKCWQVLSNPERENLINIEGNIFSYLSSVIIRTYIDLIRLKHREITASEHILQDYRARYADEIVFINDDDF